MMATVVAKPLPLIYLFLTFTLSQCWSRSSLFLFTTAYVLQLMDIG